MSFFQNPFAADFVGAWLLSDRQYSVDFKCPRNAGRGDEMVTVWAVGPYNLSGNDSDGNSKSVLTLSFAMNDYKNWCDLQVTISGASSSAITPQEVVTSLLSNTTFADFFTARLDYFSGGESRVIISQKKDATRFRFYVKNTGAETVLRFNKLAGVAELPTYFDRHTTDQRFAFPDAQNALVRLLPASLNVDAAVIDNAVDAKGNTLNYAHGTVKADWQLLAGRAGLFQFQKNTLDGSGRVTATIEYHAGAQVGDMAKKTTYSYTSTNTTPTTVAEQPYVLQSADLITPP